ncbi:MAG: hypothetical protein OJF62_000826 [Pseudolabrys sp.]|jgi:hypothetical protein|nr:hypothetical protein [Pseudolabrys sp.]
MRFADSALTRRQTMTALAGAALCPLLSSRGFAGERAIAGLIERARDLPAISARMSSISRGLLGHRYQANTLIGGPKRPEVFVVRDDRFDCVTFCETVLAAARSRDIASFEINLKAIRYRDGVVAWRERNHDFAAWCARNVAGGVCEPIGLGPPTDLRKVLDAPRALGRRIYDIAAVSRATLMAKQGTLRDGDIVGFVSERRTLDYYHTGLVMFGSKGEFMLRHASESRGRVLDQPMQQFLAANRVRYVTLLRPHEQEETKKS